VDIPSAHDGSTYAPEVTVGERMRMPEQAVKTYESFIWSVADLLRGDYKQSEYGKVILPLTVLRRLDCVLASTKGAVLDRPERLRGWVVWTGSWRQTRRWRPSQECEQAP